MVSAPSYEPNEVFEIKGAGNSAVNAYHFNPARTEQLWHRASASVSVPSVCVCGLQAVTIALCRVEAWHLIDAELRGNLTGRKLGK